MKAASQVPSGVLTSTLVSTTSGGAASAEPAAPARPAAIERATKSRRGMSPAGVSFLGWFFGSSVMEAPLERSGRRGWTRTSDPQLRRLMLYPPELRAHVSIVASQYT